MTKKNFLETLYFFYKNNKRLLPFRETIDPYWIFITEVMLQQTQVKTVVNKFDLFIKTFPSFIHFSKASFEEILTVWKGLGYNRRALFLKKSIQRLVEEYNGIIPSDPLILKTFPGIGINTASSIIVFTYNIPLIFIETNIRTVFIHHFFSDRKDKVDDKEILPLVARCLDLENPRKFYYALMDYGSFLKKQIKNINYKSKHYTKQSRFKDSNREVRSKILEVLLEKKEVLEADLFQMINDDRIQHNLEKLEKEELILKKGSKYFLA